MRYSKIGRSFVERLKVYFTATANFSAVNILAGLFCVWYAWVFWDSVYPLWFNPEWTTDDALQQIYPFHKVLHPELFKGDLITRMMECYLAPLHYWLCYAVTWLTKDPIMMGHWVMLIQVLLSSLFVFLAIRQLAGVAPAFFGVAWLLHTRHIMQRMTAGLPRGWAGPVLSAYLYYVLKGNHLGVLIVIFLGCLAHPPSTLLIALAYGLTLLWRVARLETRRAYLRPLLVYALLSPVFALTAYSVVKMPPEIGSMTTYEQAKSMPEFQMTRDGVSGGRFAFLPFRPAVEQIRIVGLQAFVGRFYKPPQFLRSCLPYLVIGILLILLAVGQVRKRESLPAELWIYLISVFVVYFASRLLAFRLYVPDRHLQFPLAFFFTIGLTAMVWRTFYQGDTAVHPPDGTAHPAASGWRQVWASSLGLMALGFFIYLGSGLGTSGKANFNYSLYKRGQVFKWISEHTPLTALIAGHPTFIDPLQLFGMRQAYITTETYHPFYDRYHEQVKPRLEVSFRANYAGSFEELLSLTEPQKIDYFVFENSLFTAAELADTRYYPPYDVLVKKLSSRAPEEYAFSRLPRSVDLRRFPPMVYRDRIASVVDLRKLRAFVEAQKASVREGRS
jgi:hypothetical protein